LASKNEAAILARLATESQNILTGNLDKLSVKDMISILHGVNSKPAIAVERVLPEICLAVEIIAERLRRNGRLLYFGAGTSGRIGVLDASECPPTFGVEPELVYGYVAGGDTALRSSIEGAEDDPQLGMDAVRMASVGPSDVVVGIAASGRTPFTIGALRGAKAIGAATIAVVNVSGSKMEKIADLTIAALTGPEPLTGSTRLKAGTAQKMILNLLSTAAMVRLGKTYGNLMVDVRATNKKLKDRAIRIVTEVTGSSEDSAVSALDRCSWEAKTAIAMLFLDLDVAEARERIARAGGFLRQALGKE
jgi:N-acetylmuramic acid 6-phosphate etherase